MIFLLAYMFIVRPQKNSKKLIESRLAEKKQVYKSALRAAHEETRIRLNEQIESLQNRLKDFVAEYEDSVNLTFDLSQIAEEKKVTKKYPKRMGKVFKITHLPRRLGMTQPLPAMQSEAKAGSPRKA